MVSVSRYKSRITHLIATSLGRPVRLSSVELRLLPRPGFVLTDLSVAEDPAYGAEPVLHANSVTASIRLLSLWRGRLEIGSISVDEASLNLVRSGPGRWNLDPLFRTAVAQTGSGENGAAQRDVAPLPSLEATNSRINVKNGAEKLPFSLVNTDLEFWQENPGKWRIRLRGQPARTDVSLYQEDTGVVRLEATVGRAPALRAMPLHLDLDWQEAQLGQLAKLVTGSDPGWRGDLTGELHLDGTANAAQITTRLRASGVHRAEFAPAEALDFDANCSLVYHYSRRAVENLVCDSPLGDGRIRVTGDLPNKSGLPHLSFELDRISVAAGLDALRTLRSDLPPDLQAGGAVSGKILYAPSAAVAGTEIPAKPARRRPPTAAPAAPDPLTGSLEVAGFELSGAGLNRPIQIPKITVEPAHSASQASGDRESLAGTATLPAGGSVPLSLDLRFTRSGYQVALRGPATFPRAAEFFRIAGLAAPAGLDALAGDPILLDLNAEGAWLPPQEIPPADEVAVTNPEGGIASPRLQGGDTLSGTLTVRNANWRADFLANHVQISQATLHLGGTEIRWDPIDFVYGAVKGTATLAVPVRCEGPDPCPPHFQMHLGAVDAATLQTAILGVQQKGTLFSSLIDRLHPSSAPPWPQLEGTIYADSLILGPVTLREPSATLRIVSTGAEITDLSAGLLGGRVDGSGTFARPATDQNQPVYSLDCRFEGLSAQSVGQLVGERWSGGALNGNGKIELSGYADSDLAGSAKGTLHFEWRHGGVVPKDAADLSAAATPPPVLAHFDAWIADAAIGNGAITLTQSHTQSGSRQQPIEGKLTFADPPELHFSPSNPPGSGQP
jgi:hypothetical protein